MCMDCAPELYSYLMYLGLKAASACVDTNGDGKVSITEVQKVINGYLVLQVFYRGNLDFTKTKGKINYRITIKPNPG